MDGDPGSMVALDSYNCGASLIFFIVTSIRCGRPLTKHSAELFATITINSQPTAFTASSDLAETEACIPLHDPSDVSLI